MVASPYMTVAEAAKYLRLPDQKTLERFAKDGKIEYILIDNQRLFTADLLDKFALQRLHKVGRNGK